MRTLVVAGEYPWPENSGSRMRLLTTLGGLHRLGPCDLFSVVPGRRADLAEPDTGPGRGRVGRCTYDDPLAARLGTLSTVVRPSMPLGVPARPSTHVQRSLRRFMAGHYDLVWYFGVGAWVLAGEPADAPFVLDLDDLEDQKIAARRSIRRPAAAAPAARARAAGASLLAAADARRWRRLYRRASRRSRTTLVCSRLDADRAGGHGVVHLDVVPNAYPTVDRPLGRPEVRSPPTVLLQGTLRYPPNADAARYLVRQVAPALWRERPDVHLRLVGRGSAALAELHDPPLVTVVDQVPDIAVELERADLVLVPVRFGSGTRVKILEAFAHRIPVVSTTLGAEGLGVRDGEHLLLGDSPEALAAASARLLSDRRLRVALTGRAHALYLDRFHRDVVEAEVARIATGASR